MASAKVKELLLEENRPLSAQDVCTRLEKEFSKAVISKALDELSDRGVLCEKLLNKQKIYWPNEDQFGRLDAAELKGLDLFILQRSAVLTEVEKSIRALEAEVKLLSNSLTTEELRTKLSEGKEKVELLERKLDGFKSEGLRVVTKEDMKVAEVQRHKFVTEWKKRKRMATDMFSAILENYPKKKKEWMEEVGIETDEDKNVQMPK